MLLASFFFCKTHKEKRKRRAKKLFKLWKQQHLWLEIINLFPLNTYCVFAFFYYYSISLMPSTSNCPPCSFSCQKQYDFRFIFCNLYASFIYLYILKTYLCNNWYASFHFHGTHIFPFFPLGLYYAVYF